MHGTPRGFHFHTRGLMRWRCFRSCLPLTVTTGNPDCSSRVLQVCGKHAPGSDSPGTTTRDPGFPIIGLGCRSCVRQVQQFGHGDCRVKRGAASPYSNPHSSPQPASSHPATTSNDSFPSDLMESSCVGEGVILSNARVHCSVGAGAVQRLVPLPLIPVASDPVCLSDSLLSEQIVRGRFDSKVINNGHGPLPIGVSLGDFPIHSPVGQKNDRKTSF